MRKVEPLPRSVAGISRNSPRERTCELQLERLRTLKFMFHHFDTQMSDMELQYLMFSLLG
jgi:hypothetical protein